jgi:hypothetical protein
MNIDLKTEHEWSVRALNIHGIFFERWCAQSLRDSGRWRVRSSNYPVKYPTAPELIGKETSVDIWAEYRRGQTLLTFVIECKKNNPSFVDWVLFGSDFEYFDVHQLENRVSGNVAGWSCLPIWSSIHHDGFIADEARETRGNYLSYTKSDKTKTSNAAISEAAYQVAIGAQAIAAEEESRSSHLAERSKTADLPWANQVIVPVIVTSAKLFRAVFDARRVAGSSGEIAPEDVVLRQVPFAVYKYALPRHLQDPLVRIDRMQDPTMLERAARRHIIIVTSDHFAEFLVSEFAANLAV